MIATHLSSHLDAFLQRVSRRRSAATAANYRHYLKRFLAFTRDPVPTALDVTLIERYRTWLERSAKLSASTRYYHLVGLRNYLRYLTGHGVATLDYHRVKLGVLRSAATATPDAGQRRQLATAVQQLEPRAMLRTRDAAILELLTASRLRIAQVASLRRADIDVRRDAFILRDRHGRPRLYPLSAGARSWIRQYLNLRKDRAPHLFIRHDRAGGRTATSPGPQRSLTPRSIQRNIRRYAGAAGLEMPVTPRSLRKGANV